VTNGMGHKSVTERVYSRVEGLTRQQARQVVEAVFGAITESLGEGETIRVPGFGSFSVSERAARKGRNPATGESITIKASKSVRFKPSRELKASLQSRRRARA